MALALIKEKRSGAKSPWAAYIAQLPNEYDLLGMWTDDQLVELHSPKLEIEAKRQRSENAAAASAVCKPLKICLLYTSPSPRDQRGSRMPSSA